MSKAREARKHAAKQARKLKLRRRRMGGHYDYGHTRVPYYHTRRERALEKALQKAFDAEVRGYKDADIEVTDVRVFTTGKAL